MKKREESSKHRGFKYAAMTLLTALLVVAGLYSTQLMAATQDKGTEPAAAPARPAMPVETTEVKIAESLQELLAVGTLRSNESVVIRSEVPGRIAKIAFSEGKSTTKGKLLFKLDNAVMQAEYDRADAVRSLSEDNYQRADSLLRLEAISEIERDEAYAKWQLDEATTRLARAQLNKATITAPFSGKLGLRSVSIGDYIQPGQPLVNLEEMDQLKVDFHVPERFSAQVTVGQQFSITTDSHAGERFTGSVLAINPRVDETSRSLVVRGLIANSSSKLRPGQFAKVSLILNSKTDAIFIPEQALIPQPTSQMVFRVVDGAADMVPVQIGQRKRGWVEIVSGLSAGDMVITGGHQKIGPGSPVHAMPADPQLFSTFDLKTANSETDNG